ncbi:hypothetical protein U1Q18_017650, partial [Sarracenia purpurea var. burkii]
YSYGSHSSAAHMALPLVASLPAAGVYLPSSFYFQEQGRGSVHLLAGEQGKLHFCCLPLAVLLGCSGGFWFALLVSACLGAWMVSGLLSLVSEGLAKARHFSFILL